MAETLCVAEPAFAQSYPELHHYTSYTGLAGILESQNIWASHFFHLNDSCEISLLRDPLAKALRRRLLRALIERQRESLRVRRFLQKHGGASCVAGDAVRLIETLYDQIFGGGRAVPFIASFCSHVDDQTYEQTNGLLSQWRGYGKGGGFCIVFDTAALVDILQD